ncbi:hypothetical protein BJ508DRAFT_307352 [Ascobolus immersus RN42]|uniref:Uncharacterized protein n=1 Tax=Ascobolus immersus RN42 TaxID=1160509 RepID=A0A3N4I771_ASCIM|nr:hypothetical protein BJ508DRAFT_307352 [Ascobolus immersus RN42]
MGWKKIPLHWKHDYEIVRFFEESQRPDDGSVIDYLELGFQGNTLLHSLLIRQPAHYRALEWLFKHKPKEADQMQCIANQNGLIPRSVLRVRLDNYRLEQGINFLGYKEADIRAQFLMYQTSFVDGAWKGISPSSLAWIGEEPRANFHLPGVRMGFILAIGQVRRILKDKRPPYSTALALKRYRTLNEYGPDAEESRQALADFMDKGGEWGGVIWTVVNEAERLGTELVHSGDGQMIDLGRYLQGPGRAKLWYLPACKNDGDWQWLGKVLTTHGMEEENTRLAGERRYGVGWVGEGIPFIL